MRVKIHFVIAVAMMATMFAPAATAAGDELPLPRIPDSLRVPQERAAYLVEHFWDAMDFSNPARGRSPEFVEQNLVNFVSLFPHSRPDALPTGVHNLMKRAEADADAYRLVCESAEKYLYEHESPFCNEEYYALFLNEMLASTLLGEYERTRPAYQLECVRKNRVGSIAADFRFSARDGGSSSLHTTAAGYLLLLFFDPECDHCMEVIGQLNGDAAVSAALADGRLAVLAIYPDGDPRLWRSVLPKLPASWHAGFDPAGAIRRNGVYDFPSMPTLYLLDGDKRVVLKNTSPAAVAEYLSAIR